MRWFDPRKDFMEEADREMIVPRSAPAITSTYKYSYKQPERLASSEIRQRRLEEQLRRTRLELEGQPERLSPANKRYLIKVKEFEDKFGTELKWLKTALKEGQYFTKARKARLFQLFRLQQVAQEQRPSHMRPSKVSEKPFVDRAFGFNPVSIPKVFRNPAGDLISKMAWISNPANHPSFAIKKVAANIPCVQRMVRREVLFAKRQAGKGHRSPHHKGPFSQIGC